MALIHTKVENLNGIFEWTKSFAILTGIEDENFILLQPGSEIEDFIPTYRIFHNQSQDLKFSEFDLLIDTHAVGLRLK